MKIYEQESIFYKLQKAQEDLVVKLIKEDTVNESINETRFVINGRSEELNFIAVSFAVGLVIFIILAGFIDERNITDNMFYQDDINLNFTAVLFAVGLIVLIVLTGFTGTTILTITMIAYNRYKLVLDPSTYRNLYIRRNIVIMLVLAWIIPLICLCPAIFQVWGNFGYVQELVTCNLTFDENSRLFRIFLLATRALMPCIVIIYLYSMIFRATHRSHQRLQCVNKKTFFSYEVRKHKNFKKEMRLTKMMMAIFIVFIISYFPCTISSIIDWNNTLSQNFHMYCVISVYIGSAVNPVVYGLMNKQFRKEYKKILTCSRFENDIKEGTSCSRVYVQNFKKIETIQVRLSFPLLTQEEVEKAQTLQ
ncbi:hypothetical protein KUTeg_020222 [Tegillarca granosa]|uniref:G-protein coupled receptors family 1 profile domain-containing protein n=1 Tax=Tegillarca granosa TaxID=220873 RepID=A0ABQ9E7U6_TEGGR|nr:hypothetical protein KUTeg_020222 [Tegillarca granosa]